MRAYDVAIIGGGIVGSSAAWFLAEAGARVVLLERAELAAGASGRNSGAVQHPLDPLPGELHQRTLEIYRELSHDDADFSLAGEPAGLLLVSADEDALRAEQAAIAQIAPQLQPQFLDPHRVQQLEPSLAAGLAATRLETGYPVAPAAATLAFARRARQAGADLRMGAAATLVLEADRAVGVRLASGEQLDCSQVLLATGPWTAELVPAWRAAPPIRPVWGVVASVALERPPRHVLEELGIGDRDPMAPTLFSLVTAAGQSGVGSIFLEREPDPRAVAPELLQRGASFVPEIAGARMIGVRACARPAAADRRPLVGAVAGYDGLFVCAGHGPWGISTAPATARLVSQLMWDGASPELASLTQLSPSRFPMAT